MIANTHTIRSFVRRAGRMTRAQKIYQHRDHPHLFRLPLDPDPSQLIALQSWIAATAQDRPWGLDIGFGMGDSTLALAQNLPQWQWFAIDVYPPGSARLLRLMQEHHLDSIRIIEADVAQAIAVFPQQSLSLIKTFFPDPWQKARHHKRRLIQSAFAQTLVQYARADALWHIVTDWQDYAEHIEEALLHTRWRLIARTSHRQVAQTESLSDPRTLSPATKFARRAIAEGRLIHSFMYTPDINA